METHVLIAGFGVIISIAVGIIAYFLRKVDAKVDSSAKDITEIKIQMAGFGGKFTQSIGDLFTGICSDRQGACSRLNDARFKALEKSDTSNCNKLHHLEEEMKQRWGEQLDWNKRVESRVYSLFANGKGDKK